MYEKMEWIQDLNGVYKQLPKGAFLTVKGDERQNTMTIGWGFFGIMWGRPICIVAVRKSRYTYELMEEAQDFTVSVPVDVELKKALGLCGSKSGRDLNKFEAANITAAQAKKVQSPIIAECDQHFECKILYSQEMDEGPLADVVKGDCYEDGDYHVFYYGEIVDRYELAK